MFCKMFILDLFFGLDEDMFSDGLLRFYFHGRREVESTVRAPREVIFWKVCGKMAEQK